MSGSGYRLPLLFGHPAGQAQPPGGAGRSSASTLRQVRQLLDDEVAGRKQLRGGMLRLREAEIENRDRRERGPALQYMSRACGWR